MTVSEDDPRLRLATKGGRLASLVEMAIRLRHELDYAQFEERQLNLDEILSAIDWLDEVEYNELVNLQVLCKSAWDKAGEAK